MKENRDNIEKNTSRIENTDKNSKIECKCISNDNSTNRNRNSMSKISKRNQSKSKCDGMCIQKIQNKQVYQKQKSEAQGNDLLKLNKRNYDSILKEILNNATAIKTKYDNKLPLNQVFQITDSAVRITSPVLHMEGPKYAMIECLKCKMKSEKRSVDFVFFCNNCDEYLLVFENTSDEEEKATSEKKQRFEKIVSTESLNKINQSKTEHKKIKESARDISHSKKSIKQENDSIVFTDSKLTIDDIDKFSKNNVEQQFGRYNTGYLTLGVHNVSTADKTVGKKQKKNSDDSEQTRSMNIVSSDLSEAKSKRSIHEKDKSSNISSLGTVKSVNKKLKEMSIQENHELSDESLTIQFRYDSEWVKNTNDREDDKENVSTVHTVGNSTGKSSFSKQETENTKHMDITSEQISKKVSESGHEKEQITASQKQDNEDSDSELKKENNSQITIHLVKTKDSNQTTTIIPESITAGKSFSQRKMPYTGLTTNSKEYEYDKSFLDTPKSEKSAERDQSKKKDKIESVQNQSKDNDKNLSTQSVSEKDEDAQKMREISDKEDANEQIADKSVKEDKIESTDNKSETTKKNLNSSLSNSTSRKSVKFAESKTSFQKKERTLLRHEIVNDLRRIVAEEEMSQLKDRCYVCDYNNENMINCICADNVISVSESINSLNKKDSEIKANKSNLEKLEKKLKNNSSTYMDLVGKIDQDDIKTNKVYLKVNNQSLNGSKTNQKESDKERQEISDKKANKTNESISEDHSQNEDDNQSKNENDQYKERKIASAPISLEDSSLLFENDEFKTEFPSTHASYIAVLQSRVNSNKIEKDLESAEKITNKEENMQSQIENEACKTKKNKSSSIEESMINLMKSREDHGKIDDTALKSKISKSQSLNKSKRDNIESDIDGKKSDHTSSRKNSSIKSSKMADYDTIIAENEQVFDTNVSKKKTAKSEKEIFASDTFSKEVIEISKEFSDSDKKKNIKDKQIKQKRVKKSRIDQEREKHSILDGKNEKSGRKKKKASTKSKIQSQIESSSEENGITQLPLSQHADSDIIPRYNLKSSKKCKRRKNEKLYMLYSRMTSSDDLSDRSDKIEVDGRVDQLIKFYERIIKKHKRNHKK